MTIAVRPDQHQRLRDCGSYSGRGNRRTNRHSHPQRKI